LLFKESYLPYNSSFSVCKRLFTGYLTRLQGYFLLCFPTCLFPSGSRCLGPSSCRERIKSLSTHYYSIRYGVECLFVWLSVGFAFWQRRAWAHLMTFKLLPSPVGFNWNTFNKINGIIDHGAQGSQLPRYFFDDGLSGTVALP